MIGNGPGLKPPKDYLVVAGPTGSGKSDLAMALADRLGGEIVGCDSVQIYRGFDIGSAKPSPADRLAVPHHMIDRLAWHEECDAALYAKGAAAAIADVRGRGKVPIVVGGTGLYLRALIGRGWHSDLPKDEALRAALQEQGSAELYATLQSLDPVRAAALHPNDRFRVVRALELVTLLGKTLGEAGLTAPAGQDPGAWILVLEPPRAELHERIERRAASMVALGLVDEVRALVSAGVAVDCKPMRSIGYLETTRMIRGDLAPGELARAITVATRRYAKRQMTWNRKVEADLRLPSPDFEAVLTAAKGALAL